MDQLYGDLLGEVLAHIDNIDLVRVSQLNRSFRSASERRHPNFPDHAHYLDYFHNGDLYSIVKYRTLFGGPTGLFLIDRYLSAMIDAGQQELIKLLRHHWN